MWRMWAYPSPWRFAPSLSPLHGEREKGLFRWSCSKAALRLGLLRQGEQMIRTVYAFGRAMAVAAMLGAVAPAAHAAQDKPLSDADIAEGRALIETYAVPLMRDIDGLVKLAASDPAKGCAQARANEARAVELNTKILALHKRLTAEGKRTEGFDKMIAGADQMMTGTHDTVRGICSGAMSKTGDPAHDAIIGKLVALSSRLTGAMNASMQAEERGDHAAACAQLREGDAAFDDLYAYLKTLRAQLADGSADAAQMDAAIAKALPLKAQLASHLDACPAVSAH